MGTYQNPVQRAVVLGVAVISTLLDGTFDALIGIAVHNGASFVFGFGVSIAQSSKINQEFFANLAISPGICYLNKRK